MEVRVDERSGALRPPGAILLISCYELGHLPAGVRLPLSFLEAAGFRPSSLDAAIQVVDEASVGGAGLVGISVPMHTALRVGAEVAQRVRRWNPRAHLCFYGLYAWLNADYLLAGLADSVIGGEAEGALVLLADALDRGAPWQSLPGIASRGRPARPILKKLAFPAPSGTPIPSLDGYAKLQRVDGSQIPAGYVEASRGCLHLCRHCPIPPVYQGRFFTVPREVVLADIDAQIAAGARHITFGDPDFLNGPGHAMALVRALHERHPQVSYDVTAKVEHLLKHRALLPQLTATGCAFVVSALESLSDVVLGHLDKGHRAEDIPRALEFLDAAALPLRPTFVPFTPWTQRSDQIALLRFVEEHGLAAQVDPIQYTLRLLIPPGSALLAHPGSLPRLGPLDPKSLYYPWAHDDPRMDELARRLRAAVEEDLAEGRSSSEIFARVKRVSEEACDLPPSPAHPSVRARAPAPRLTESWFCCAEPHEGQLALLGVPGSEASRAI